MKATQISKRKALYSASYSASSIESLEARRLLTASWTPLTNAAPGGIEATILLPNGDVMGQLGGGAGWALLTPSSTGSYINGTWSHLSNAPDTRLYYSTETLENGSIYIAGGEYGTGGATGAIYNPLTNTWTPIPAGVGSYIDADSEILANGVVLEAPVYPASSGATYLYNPSTNTWSPGPQLYRGSDADERSWIKLADGSILSPDGNLTSERYIPSLNQWVNDATTTIPQTDSEGEFGPGALLPDGQVIFFGTGSTSEIYTPSGYNSATGIYSPNGTVAGTFSAGPTLPSGLGTDDAPDAVLPDGNVLFSIGPIDSYSGPSSFYIYNTQSNTISLATGAPSESDPPYVNRFLTLPDGTVLMSVDGSTLYDYNDAGTTLTAPTPTITSVVQNSDGTYLLTGTQLNGNSEGGYYGDDAQMNSNYPIVRLTSSSGTVYFARTYNWSSDGVDTGTTPVSTDFTLPLGLPSGTYTLNVMVNGFISANYSLTNPAATDTAPTITTAAAATPSTVTGLTTSLSVTANGSSGLIYTWLNTSAPSGDSTASFSTNGTATSNNTTVTFQQAGTYKFTVTATDALGLSVTSSSVTVTVNQTLTSVTVTPNPASLTSGSTQQLTAKGYDQFGNTMTSQPTFTWSVSGAGSVNSSGGYTTPSTGGVGTVTATTGSLSATDPMYTVSYGWTSADIGSPGVAGYAWNNGGTYNVSGSGSDVWGTSDEFHYLYQTTELAGAGEIIAEVAAEPNPLTTWEKAGVMMRSTLSDSSQQAFMAITPGNGAAMQWRTTAGGSSTNSNTTGPTAPYWVKLVRNGSGGSTFTGFYSSNGVNWTEETSTTITMTGSVYVGLFIVSQSNTADSTATFTNVSSVQALPVSLNVSAGSAVSTNVLTNATGPQGDTLTLTSVTQPTKGSVTFNSSGGVTYTANANVSGTDSFTYTMTDGVGDYATATVSVDIYGLQAYYHLNEDTGTTSADATGDGYTATLSGATWGTGVDSSYGLVFSGTSQYATLPALNLNSNTVTLSGWIDRGSTEPTAAGVIFERETSSAQGLDFNTTTALGYTWGTSTYNSGLKPTTGTWTFVALVVTPTSATIYMEPLGGSMTSATQTGTFAAEAFSAVTGLGEDPTYTNRDFKGSMDEVRIYNVNLSAGQIASLASLTPTITTPAAASPSPATGNTAALSVTGTSYLGSNVPTYTWAATNVPSGATTPTFSVNGTNAANDTTVTFYKAGNYTFTVTVADPSGLSTTSNVSESVVTTPTSIVVTPSSASLASHGGQTFSAIEYDQFGNAVGSQPAFTWSSTGSGSINASTGAYTAGYATGTATVTAAAGSVAQTAAVTITDSSPSVTTAAAASPSTVTGTTTSLSVAGSDDGGADLTYTWATTGSPPAAVSFSANGNSSAAATVATFAKAGSYTFQVTLTDAGGLSATSSVLVTVNQTATVVAVAPATVGLNENQNQTFTVSGYDQFGSPYGSAPAVTWSATGVGSINSSTGVYNSGGAAGTATVYATGVGFSASATVAVTDSPPVVTIPASASPSPVKVVTTKLSVAGTSDAGASNLTYTWAATSIPAGASIPTFSVNGTTASNVSTARFYHAGAYTFTVTLNDGQGQTATSSVNVTVNATPYAAVITPANPTLDENQTQAFSAVANDQFGIPLTTQPTFTWAESVGGAGSINSSTGVYTTGNTPGNATIYVSAGSAAGNTYVTVIDAPPAITTPAAAAPSPVTGKTTALSVTGNSDTGASNLTYTWAATTIPGGASSPTFSVNGTNAAQNTTATFANAGTYGFTVTLNDGQGQTNTSSVSVTVNQTLTSIVVTPSTTSLNENQAQTFSATGYDQFGVALANQPAFTWAKTSGIGSINASTGVYNSPASTGTAAITATSSSVSGSANLTVTDSAPTVVTPAAATPSPVTGTTTALGVAGNDDGGASSLTYTWAATAIPSGASAPSFTINGNNAAQNTTATFSKAGNYTFTATIADGQGGVVTSSVNVTVNQSLTTIVVNPTTAALYENQTEAFTATGYDQFGVAMASQPSFTWAKTAGIGAINSSTGAYTSPGAAGSATVTAANASVVGSAGITVTDSNPTVTTTAAASPSPVTGLTTALSVAGNSDAGASNLTYTWTATSVPDGAAAPTFSINATNAAQNTTATFSQAGAYTFTVSLSDGQGGTAASSVSVTVNQTLTSIVVSPATAYLNENQTESFSATAYDQFGIAMASQPTFVWAKSTGIGSINASTGVYSSSGTSGAATITASSASVVGSAGVSITNAAPTVATAAAASPATVTAKTTALSVLGADDNGESNLTYTWQAITLPDGATAPSYSINGTNAAKSTTATFYQAGSYTLMVTLTDNQGATVTSSVNVTVNQTLTTITVSPASMGINENATAAFSATAYDQFGIALASQPTFTWAKTSGIGSINASTGVYASPAAAGSANITATSGSIAGSASVTVTDSNPNITTSATATPSPVTGTTAALSVAGDSDAGASNLTYTWAATTIPNGAAAPTFSINSTNAAQSTTATFYQAGNYAFTVTLNDGQGGTTTSSVSVTVNQTLSSVTLASTQIVAGKTTQATADDQFGNGLLAAPAWTATGGTITTAGLFTAASTGGSYTITATLGSSANASVTIVPTSFTGTTGSDTFAIRLSPTDPSSEQIFVNSPETGAPTYAVPISQLANLSFTSASDGAMTIDFANGNPLPAGGLSYSGGSTLFIDGSSAGGMGFTVDGSHIVDTAAPTSPITYSFLQSIEFDLAGGSNTLTQSAQPTASVTYNAGPLNNTLTINGGSFTINSDPQIASGSLTINDNAAVAFSPAAIGTGYTARNVQALNLGANATATLEASTTATDRLVLETNSLTIANGATLDIGNNAMIAHGSDIAGITTLITKGLNSSNNGYWNGTGITSSNAAGDTTFLTAVGAISNNLGSGNALYSTFDNQPVSIGDVLIRYTYVGDANLDGKIDGTDYSRIDNTAITPATGWFNGDFNYDSTVNGSDYTLMDNAFNTQGSQLPKTAPVLPSPTAYYKFNDGISTVASDSSGNGYTAAQHNTTLATGVDDTAGLAFNGTDSYVSLPALNLNSNTVTFTGWIDTNGPQTQETGLIFNRNGTAGNGLTINNGNRLGYSWGSSGATSNFNSDLVIPNGQWTFVALSVGPKEATLYMQPEGGQMTSATNYVDNPVESFSTPTDLGEDSLGGRNFKGAIDEVRVYNSALTTDEILTVSDLAPTITTAASSIESDTIAMQTLLSVQAASQAGASNLTYTWKATSGPSGGTVGFSNNGTASSNSTVATASLPGHYTFTVTVTDPGYLSVTSSVNQYFDSYPLDIAELNIYASPKGQGVVPLDMGNFDLNSRTPTDFNYNADASDHWVLIFNSFTLEGPYTQVDIGNNDMIIHSPDAATAQQTLTSITSYVDSGFGWGGANNWTNPGIISSVAADAGLGRSAITVMLNSDANGKAIYTTFDGQAVTATDVLVKYNGN